MLVGDGPPPCGPGTSRCPPVVLHPPVHRAPPQPQRSSPGAAARPRPPPGGSGCRAARRGVEPGPLVQHVRVRRSPATGRGRSPPGPSRAGPADRRHALLVRDQLPPAGQQPLARHPASPPDWSPRAAARPPRPTRPASPARCPPAPGRAPTPASAGGGAPVGGTSRPSPRPRRGLVNARSAPGAAGAAPPPPAAAAPRRPPPPASRRSAPPGAPPARATVSSAPPPPPAIAPSSAPRARPARLPGQIAASSSGAKGGGCGADVDPLEHPALHRPRAR